MKTFPGILKLARKRNEQFCLFPCLPWFRVLCSLLCAHYLAILQCHHPHMSTSEQCVGPLSTATCPGTDTRITHTHSGLLLPSQKKAPSGDIEILQTHDIGQSVSIEEHLKWNEHCLRVGLQPCEWSSSTKSKSLHCNQIQNKKSSTMPSCFDQTFCSMQDFFSSSQH